MKHHPFKAFVWLGLFIIVFCVSCGGGNGGGAPTETLPQEIHEAAPTVQGTETRAVVADALLVASLQDVQKAVILVEADGKFVNPPIGRKLNPAARGAGVIIDPEGIAITSSHSVTGAETIRVWVGGSSAGLHEAVILGVSECADLAVIDIEGSGFPYLQWFEGNILVGQEVYAADFETENGQFILSDGIVSKAAAGGETDLASMNLLIEHTAEISQFAAGGALVDAQGSLLGIQLAGLIGADQNFAISRDEALPIINELRQGKNLDSVGINGIAINGSLNQLPISGVWVRSVAGESLASRAGIQAGDLIYKLHDEILAADGTLSVYCDELRMHADDYVLPFALVRSGDLSVWEGEFNGKALEQAGYFGDVASELSGIPANCQPSDAAGYLACKDDTGVLLIDVLEDWLEFDGSEWIYNGEPVGVKLTASPDLEAYAWNKNTPGLFIGASSTFGQWGGHVEFLDVYTPWYREACSFDRRTEYDDGVYQGKLDYYSNCDGQGGNAYVLAAVPIDAPASAMIIISIQLPAGQEDLLKHILSSFYVGDLTP